METVRREIGRLTDTYAVAVRQEGVAILLYLPDYQMLDLKQCFTKIRKEIEKQRDLFGDIRCTVCLGSRKEQPEQLSHSLREALWLCRDRLCRVQPWRDAENDKTAFDERFQMDNAQKSASRRHQNIWTKSVLCRSLKTATEIFCLIARSTDRCSKTGSDRFCRPVCTACSKTESWKNTSVIMQKNNFGAVQVHRMFSAY